MPKIYTEDYEGDDRRSVNTKIRIDKSIRLGDVLTIVTILAGMIGLSGKLESRMTALETKVEFLVSGRLR